MRSASRRCYFTQASTDLLLLSNKAHFIGGNAYPEVGIALAGTWRGKLHSDHEQLVKHRLLQDGFPPKSTPFCMVVVHQHPRTPLKEVPFERCSTTFFLCTTPTPLERPTCEPSIWLRKSRRHRNVSQINRFIPT